MIDDISHIKSESKGFSQKIIINDISHIKSVGKWVSKKIMINDISHNKPVGKWVSQKLMIDEISHIKCVNECVSQNNDRSDLQISCVFAFFTLWKRVKMHVLSDQSVHIMHTYCCVSKLSKFGAYLYSRVHNNTFLSLRNSL